MPRGLCHDAALLHHPRAGGVAPGISIAGSSGRRSKCHNVPLLLSSAAFVGLQPPVSSLRSSSPRCPIPLASTEHLAGRRTSTTSKLGVGDGRNSERFPIARAKRSEPTKSARGGGRKDAGCVTLFEGFDLRDIAHPGFRCAPPGALFRHPLRGFVASSCRGFIDRPREAQHADARTLNTAPLTRANRSRAVPDHASGVGMAPGTQQVGFAALVEPFAARHRPRTVQSSLASSLQSPVSGLLPPGAPTGCKSFYGSSAMMLSSG
jgi:hypothetical protein